MKTKPKTGSDALIDKCFLSRHENGQDIKWQGHILAEVAPGMYLAQLFDWIMGDPTEQIIIKLSDMLDWYFFDNVQDLKFAWSERFSHQQSWRKKQKDEETFDITKFQKAPVNNQSPHQTAAVEDSTS